MKTSLDFYQHVSLPIKAIKFLGFWYYIPYSVNSIWFWLGVLLRIIMVVSMFLISSAGQIIYLVRLIFSGNSSILEVTGIVNLILTEMLAEAKLVDMALHRDRLMKVIDQFNNKEFRCKSQAHRLICERAISISRTLFKVFLLSAGLDVFVHVVVVPAVRKFETLPLKMDFLFFDVNDPKYFKYVCAYQILYKPCMVTTFVAHQTLSWAVMSFIMSQLDVLIYNFGNMKELVKSTRVERKCDENEAFRQTFKEFVLHHSSIIRLINIFQSSFGSQLSTSLFVSATILGTTAVQFFSIQSPLENLTDVIWLLAYLNIFVGILFIDCYFGNSITYKCKHLSTCVFTSPWTDLDVTLKRNVIIFIARTQQPIVITAAKLVPISLQTFTKVMNWTYKGFAVMNQMK